MNWDTLFTITNALQDETWHIALSVISGCVAYLLTVTIFYVVYRLLRAVSASHASLTLGQSRFIHLMGLLYGLAFVWWSHMVLDWFVVAYNAPLGPHLPLILK